MRTQVFPRFGRRRFWRLVLASALAGSVWAAAPASAAGPRFSASGGVTTLSFTVTNPRTVDGVTLFDFTQHDALSGTFSGTTVIDGSCVVNPGGDSICRAFET